MAVIRQRAPMYSEGFDTHRHTLVRYSIKNMRWFTKANRCHVDSVRLVVCVRRLRCVAEFAT